MMHDITFSDILISPQFSTIKSRSDVSLDVSLGKAQLSLPVISANMKTVTGPKMATVMEEHGGLGILHRFNDTDGAIADFENAIHHINKKSYTECYYKVGVSIGVQEKDKDRFDALYTVGARLFCIDIAHGHHILMHDMIKWIKARREEVCIIAGNVASAQGAKDLKAWGADVVKVGIGPGRGCTTRKNTGVGVPQISALIEARTAVGTDYPLISDGGVTCSGDVSKALLFANAVMVGSYIAGTSESPGHVFRGEDDVLYKVYGGSASGENKTSNGQKNMFVEGITITVPFKGKVKYILKEIREGVQSALSYTGVDNLTDFRDQSQFRLISSGSRSESKY